MREALLEEMRRDERVIVMGSHVRMAISNGGITAGLLEEFGRERVLDTPVAEAALAGRLSPATGPSSSSAAWATPFL